MDLVAKGGVVGVPHTLLLIAIASFTISVFCSVILVRILATVIEHIPLVNAEGARLAIPDYPLSKRISLKTLSTLQLGTFILGGVLFVAWLCSLPQTLSHAASHAESERIAFARAIVEEYSRALSLRAKELTANDSKDLSEFRKHDEFEVLRIQTIVLPRIDAGQFEVHVDTNTISVLILDFDRHDGRLQYSVRGLSSNDETSLRQAVRERTRGNRFAEEAFAVAGFPEVPNKAVNPSGGSGGN